MVYNSETFELCHKLSKEGEERYRKILEDAADLILFKHLHPIKWTIQKIISFILKES